MKCTLGVLPIFIVGSSFCQPHHDFIIIHTVYVSEIRVQLKKNRHRKIAGAHLTAVILPHFREYSTKKNRLQYRTKFILKIE